MGQNTMRQSSSAAKRANSSNDDDSLPPTPFKRQSVGRPRKSATKSPSRKSQKTSRNDKSARKNAKGDSRISDSDSVIAIQEDNSYEPVDEEQVGEQNGDDDVGSDNEYVVEKILEKRIDKQGMVFYRVKWEGYNEISWEPHDHLSNCPELIEEFERKLEMQNQKRTKKEKAPAKSRESKAESQKSARKHKPESEPKEDGIPSSSFYKRKEPLASSENTDYTTETEQRVSISSSAAYDTPRSSLGQSSKPHKLNESDGEDDEIEAPVEAPPKSQRGKLKVKRPIEGSSDSDTQAHSSSSDDKPRGRYFWVYIKADEEQEKNISKMKQFLEGTRLQFKEMSDI